MKNHLKHLMDAVRDHGLDWVDQEALEKTAPPRSMEDSHPTNHRVTVKKDPEHPSMYWHYTEGAHEGQKVLVHRLARHAKVPVSHQTLFENLLEHAVGNPRSGFLAAKTDGEQSPGLRTRYMARALHPEQGALEFVSKPNKDGSTTPGIIVKVHETHPNGTVAPGMSWEYSHKGLKFLRPAADKMNKAEASCQTHSFASLLKKSPQSSTSPWRSLLKSLRGLKESSSLGASELEKGSRQRKMPYDPTKTPLKETAAVLKWQTQEEGREDIPRMEGTARERALQRLAGKTKTKLKDGKRLFLLHRGIGADEAKATTSQNRVKNQSLSSWAPNHGIAESFAQKAAHADVFEKKTDEYAPQTMSAWIHEDNIHHVPMQLGRVDRPAKGQPDMFARPGTTNKNFFREEHEVVVGPHDSERTLHDPNQTNLDQTITQRPLMQKLRQDFRQSLEDKMNEKQFAKSTPSDSSLYSKVKSEAKAKFKKWPSAYASGWLVKEYKRRGGGYK